MPPSITMAAANQSTEQIGNIIAALAEAIKNSLRDEMRQEMQDLRLRLDDMYVILIVNHNR
jgi:hypothetical protein